MVDFHAQTVSTLVCGMNQRLCAQPIKGILIKFLETPVDSTDPVCRTKFVKRG